MGFLFPLFTACVCVYLACCALAGGHSTLFLFTLYYITARDIGVHRPSALNLDMSVFGDGDVNCFGVGEEVADAKRLKYEPDEVVLNVIGSR